MTLLQRAIIENPDMDEKAIVLFHCPADFGLPETSCPRCLVESDHAEELEPPLLCYPCWMREAPDACTVTAKSKEEP